MTEEKAVATQEESAKQVPMSAEKAESIMLSERLARGAGENTMAFSMMPLVTIHNDRSRPEYAVGDFVKSTRTQNGYDDEKYQKPFKGIITKVRMYLKTKSQAVKDGAPERVSDEFESYNEPITLKEKRNGKYEVILEDYYKNIKDKYSKENEYGKVKKELDLIYSLYVITNLAEQQAVKILVRGMSRGNLFDFMKEFSHQEDDHMSSHWTQFDSEILTKNFMGEDMQNPVAAICFKKMEMMTLDEKRKAVAIQIAIETELNAFKKKVPVEDVPFKSIEQPAPKEELPTIQIEQNEDIEIPLVEDKKEEEIRIEDIPM